MIYRKLDANGDYTFGANSGNFLSGVEAVAQAIGTRLKLFTNEWWENFDEGLPLWDKILGQHDRDTAIKLIKERILGTDGVTNIASMDTDWNADTRSLSFTAVVDTEYGTVTATVSTSGGTVTYTAITVANGGTATPVSDTLDGDGGSSSYIPDYVWDGGGAAG
ncbi:hypothetical protein [Megasphaera cerevisiae]|uniref:hypothetical protein n=1 Tax=Megasphaera cerevisiae TaxID=39029 RepID=UPI00065AC053|nr:hypothetical protein [Megasphaera cerevisiae]SJZ58479.1 hypothetical protein SAMN05660900_00845 [Megasphaera cerevisiae DSM 20462]